MLLSQTNKISPLQKFKLYQPELGKSQECVTKRKQNYFILY
jgi:hypothetical protein